MNGFPDLADLEDRGRFRGHLGTDGDGLLNELFDALLVGVFYSYDLLLLLKLTEGDQLLARLQRTLIENDAVSYPADQCVRKELGIEHPLHRHNAVILLDVGLTGIDLLLDAVGIVDTSGGSLLISS